MWVECAACWITLHSAPEPHISGVCWQVVSLNVYSMLIAFVLKLRLENCIQIQFASNLHQIMDHLWWFLATFVSDIQILFDLEVSFPSSWNINSIYKLGCVVKLGSIVRRPASRDKSHFLLRSPGARRQAAALTVRESCEHSDINSWWWYDS